MRFKLFGTLIAFSLLTIGSAAYALAIPPGGVPLDETSDTAGVAEIGLSSAPKAICGVLLLLSGGVAAIRRGYYL